MEEQLKNAQDTIEEQSKKLTTSIRKFPNWKQKLAEKDKYIKELEELKSNNRFRNPNRKSRTASNQRNCRYGTRSC